MSTTEPSTDHASRISEIRTTLEDRASAEAIARRLVEQRLAACVQIDGSVESIYRWKDAVASSVEWRLTVKTSLGRTEECVAEILAGHPYELPEILVAEPFASDAYARWILDSTSR